MNEQFISKNIIQSVENLTSAQILSTVKYFLLQSLFWRTKLKDTAHVLAHLLDTALTYMYIVYFREY